MKSPDNINHKTQGEAPEAEILSELVEGGEIFESWGYSVIKVTKDGKARGLQLRIRTKGVREMLKELGARAPKPPVTRIQRPEEKGQDPEKENLKTDVGGGAAGMMVFDFTDEDYVKQMEEYGDEVVWKTIIQGLDIAWKKKDGTEITDYEEKKKILISNGITEEQAIRLCRDIRNLSRWQEDRNDFLPVSSLA